MIGSGDVGVQAVLLPGHVNIASKQLLLLIGPSGPWFDACEVDRDLSIIANSLVSTIDSKLFQTFASALSLELDCLCSALLLLSWKEQERWVSTYLHLAAEWLSTVWGAIDKADVHLVRVHPVKFGPSRRQALAMTTPWSEKLDEPAFVWFYLTFFLVKIYHKFIEGVKIKCLGFPICGRIILNDGLFATDDEKRGHGKGNSCADLSEESHFKISWTLC